MRHTLRDIAEIGAGQGAPQGDSNYCDNGIPFVKAGNLEGLTTGGSLLDIQKVSDSVAKAHKLKLYPEGTVLFAKSGMSCLKGYVYVLPQEAYVVSHLACITPKEKISEYLRYYFSYHKPNQLVRDAAYPSISLSDIGALEIDTKDETTRAEIISVLNTVEEIIELRKQELSSLNDLVKSRFVELFGDPISNPRKLPSKKLSLMSNLITKGASPSWQGYSYTDDSSQTLFVTSENVREGFLDLSEPKYLEDEFNEKQARSILRRGDFLINIVGASIGRAARFDRDDKANINQAVALVRMEQDEVLADYVLFYLNSPKALKMYNGMKSDVARANLSLQNIGDLEILIPPINDQQSFSLVLQHVNKSKLAIQQSLEKLEILRKSLMHHYFG